jgi:MFS family permease
MILLMFFLSRWSGGLVTRYGAKAPLIIGPLIASVGFVLFALPSSQGSYWATFFPAFVVLGLGMAVSVAPLTTVVMSSVDEDRAGTASGINNAVARVAGVLAIAVFGVFMVSAFAVRLNHLLVASGISQGVSREIQSKAIKLAGLDLPTGLAPNTANLVRSAVSQAFVFGFRLIALICAGLAIASGAVAWRMIPRVSAGASVAAD